MKKPEKVGLLIATTTMLLSCHINRAEALVFDWNVTGGGGVSFTGSGTITVAGTGPVLYNTPYTITAATGSVSYNDGIANDSVSNATITWPGSQSSTQTFETDAQGDFLLQSSGRTTIFAFDAGGDTWTITSSSTGPLDTAYVEPTFVTHEGPGQNPTITAATLSVESAPVPFEVPGGASIPAVGTLLALGVMRKVRTFKKA